MNIKLFLDLDKTVQSLVIFVVLSITSFCDINAYAQDTNELNFLNHEEINWLKEHPVIRTSNPAAITPFIFTQNGNVQGLTVDYLNLIASKIGVKFEFPEEKPWIGMMEMLNSGEVELIHSAAFSDERAMTIDFTSSYLDIPLVNVGREGSARINNPDDLFL